MIILCKKDAEYTDLSLNTSSDEQIQMGIPVGRSQSSARVENTSQACSLLESTRTNHLHWTPVHVKLGIKLQPGDEK